VSDLLPQSGIMVNNDHRGLTKGKGVPISQKANICRALKPLLTAEGFDMLHRGKDRLLPRLHVGAEVGGGAYLIMTSLLPVILR